jgi:hypothetical protein
MLAVVVTFGGTVPEEETALQRNIWGFAFAVGFNADLVFKSVTA